MAYIKCPYCNHSDGNDDITIYRNIDYIDNTECTITETKQCDICGKKYYVEKHFKFDYEKLSDDNFV